MRPIAPYIYCVRHSQPFHRCRGHVVVEISTNATTGHRWLLENIITHACSTMSHVYQEQVACLRGEPRLKHNCHALQHSGGRSQLNIPSS